MDEELKSIWKSEFGNNFFAPKMMIVGTEASEEVTISANLAGIELRLLKGAIELELNFTNINQIAEKLDQWDSFLKSGNRTIIERHRWVEEIFKKIRDFVDNYGNEDISTIGSLCKTSLKNSYVRGQAFPFVNIPIRYQEKELLGFYEYFSDELSFDESYIYCDFIIEHSYYAINKDDETLKKTVKKAKEVLRQKGYNIIAFDSGMATIKIERKILEQDEEFNKLLKRLIDDAITIQKEIILEG
jgi:Ni,Fe-hydrogenase I large subunit